MKTFSRIRPWLTTGLIGLMLGTAISLAAWGGSPLPPPAEMLLQRLSVLRDELGLTPGQAALWQTAEAQTRRQLEQMRDRHQQLQTVAQSALEEPDTDLRALALRADQVQAQNIAARKQLRESWLVFYDALDEAQREQVRIASATRRGVPRPPPPMGCERKPRNLSHY
jgi:hypothetical protein